MYHTLSKLREKRAKGDKGFTLIELLVVVVILGVLIAIAIPLYLNYRKGANDAAAQSDLKNAINVLEQCNADKATYPTSATFATATPTIGVLVNCGQTLTVSSGTTLVYTPVQSTTNTALYISYVMSGHNTSGSSTKYYCYNSAVGGAIQPETADKTTGC